MTNADLMGANLFRAICRRTNFVHSNLGGADLRRADLFEANLQDANMTGANLAGANLSGAKLRGAILVGANLSRCLVDATAFAGARCGATVFGDVDLRFAQGIKEIWHGGPSTVGVDTITKSAGEIPIEFLQGCGVAADLSERLTRDVSESGSTLYSVFISYSHRDRDFARRLYDDLFQTHGVPCWLDDHEIRPGDRIMTAIDQGVRDADRVLLICSVASLGQSTWVDREVRRAFAKEDQLWKHQRTRSGVLIPLDLDGYLFSEECTYEWAADLRERLAADFRGWREESGVYERSLNALVRALRSR